ncbi:MAG: GNAT family N-acetyltransferase [Bacilli bacterium]
MDTMNKMNFELIKFSDVDSESLKKQLDSLNSLPFNKNDASLILLENLPIGVVSITKMRNGDLDITYGIFEEYRNKKYGTTFLNYFVNLIFNDNPEQNIVTLNIYYTNHFSIKVAVNNNFKMDFSEIEKREYYGEGNELIPFYKENPRLIKKLYKK